MSHMENDFTGKRNVAAVCGTFFSVLFVLELILPERLSPPYDPRDVDARAVELGFIVLWVALALVLGFIGLRSKSRPFHLLSLFSVLLTLAFVLIIAVTLAAARLLNG